MSTATTHPPLREVFSPTDPEEVADLLAATTAQRRGWTVWLAAKRLVARSFNRAAVLSHDLIERYRLLGVLSAARRAAGWLASGASLARHGINRVGGGSVLVWLICNSTARSIAGKLTSSLTHLAGKVASKVGTVLRFGLSLLGSPGRALTAWVVNTTTQAKVGVSTTAAPLYTGLRRTLDVTSLHIRAIGALAGERAVGRLVGRALPQPWASVARIAAVGLMVPVVVRQAAVRMTREGVARLLKRPVFFQTQGAPVAPWTPANPSQPSSPAVSDVVVVTSGPTDIDGQAPTQEVTTSSRSTGSASKYPAKKAGARRR